MQSGSGIVHCVWIREHAVPHRTLMSRFWDGSTASEQQDWEGRTLEASREDEPGEDEPVVAVAAGRTIVFSRVGELLVFAVGSGVIDELILAELISCLAVVLRALLPKGPTAHGLVERYAKAWCDARPQQARQRGGAASRGR